MIFDTHELAWAAGFFDGEGSTQYKRGNRHNDLHRRTYKGIILEVSQKTPELLYRFQQAVGGFGKVYGPYRNGKNGHNTANTSYRFAVGSFSDVEFIGELLYPWLGETKRKQMTKAIRGWALAPRFDNRGHVKQTVGYGFVQQRHGVTYPPSPESPSPATQ